LTVPRIVCDSGPIVHRTLDVLSLKSAMSMMDPADAHSLLREVRTRLLRAYGVTARAGEMHPTDELVATILSQHTSDTNSHRAFRNLKVKFPTWEQVASAPEADVTDAIRSAGLANIKAPRIRQALIAIEAGYGTLDLGFLQFLPVADVKRILTALPGVGPKTAACVALFSLHKPAFPVDTHVHRIAVRLGLVHRKEPPERFQDLVEATLPAESLLDLHLNLIRHGREICRARAPRCPDCVLLNVCAYGRTMTEQPGPPIAVA
jgi:endonuclease III